MTSFVSRTGSHFVVPDIGRIELGAKGRIFSRHTGIGWRMANANPETLCRKYAGTLRSFEPPVPVSKGDCDEIWPLIVLPVASLLRGSTLIFLASQSALLESVTIRRPTVVKVLIFDVKRVEPSQEANFQIP